MTLDNRSAFARNFGSNFIRILCNNNQPRIKIIGLKIDATNTRTINVHGRPNNNFHGGSDETGFGKTIATTNNQVTAPANG